MINTFNWVYFIHKRILFISVFSALLSISLINSPCAAQVPVKSSDWIDAELYPILSINKTAGGLVQKDFGKDKYVLRKNGIIDVSPEGAVVLNSKWTATETGILTVYQKRKIQTKDVLIIMDGKMELKLQGPSECQGSLIINFDATFSDGQQNKVKSENDIRFRIVFAKKEPVNPNVVGNKPMPPSAHNESLINKSATDVINQALSDSKGNISGAEAIVQKMRRASQEASDNPALIRAQYWLKGRNGATIFGESTAYFLGSAYLSAKKWGIGFDKFTAWSEGLPWNPAPYDPATREWYNNGVQNILLAK